VSSSQALARNGGSDPVGLMSMITYAEQHYGGNPNAVYVTGASSGAMMTNVMLGDYPDVFKAGAAFMAGSDVDHDAGVGVDGNSVRQHLWGAAGRGVQHRGRGEDVTITNASYNGTVAAGGSTSAGFQGTWTTSDATPASFTLNGATCT
jgi:poly(3-hydroxybutyrate) depolymerase